MSRLGNNYMRIGLFGGTFNPIHNGHTWAAQQIKTQFKLDQICFIPSALPPHKSIRNVARAEDRLAMLQLAIADTSGFEVSDVEVNRFGPSYSINTVQHFIECYPSSYTLFFILGDDAFLEIHTWKAFKTFFDVIDFIVIKRKGAPSLPAINDEIELLQYLKQEIDSDYMLEPDIAHIHHEAKKDVYLCDIKPLAISATLVRHTIQKNQTVLPYVSEAVANYIQSKGLYQ
jgi:nicotinate-nucleotide adenylyltransferase